MTAIWTSPWLRLRRSTQNSQSNSSKNLRPTKPDRKFFDELDASLCVERRGRSHGEVQIAVNAAAVCRERTKEDRDDDRWVACQDMFNRRLKRGASLGGYVMGVAHPCSVITNGLQV